MFLCRGGARRGGASPQLSFCPFLLIATCTTVGASQTTDCHACRYTHMYKQTKVYAIVHGRVHPLCSTHCFSPHTQCPCTASRHWLRQKEACPVACGRSTSCLAIGHWLGHRVHLCHSPPRPCSSWWSNSSTNTSWRNTTRYTQSHTRIHMHAFTH